MRKSIQEGTWEIKRIPDKDNKEDNGIDKVRPFDERFSKSKTHGRSLVFTSQYLLIEEGSDEKPILTNREFDIVTIVLFDGNTTNNFDVIRVF